MGKIEVMALNQTFLPLTKGGLGVKSLYHMAKAQWTKLKERAAGEATVNGRYAQAIKEMGMSPQVRGGVRWEEAESLLKSVQYKTLDPYTKVLVA